MGTTNIALAKASRQMLHYRIHHTQPQASIYSMGLKFVQVIYESFDCDLTHDSFYLWFDIIRVFCPRADLSLQTQEPRLQFCPRQVFHCKLRNQGCSSAQGSYSTANSGTKAAVLTKAVIPLQTQEPRLQF